MRLILVTVLLTATMAIVVGVDLGSGGVFNSPAAQAYWNKRSVSFLNRSSSSQ